MALLAQTAFVSGISYENATAVFYYQQGRTTWFAVATGIPRDPSTRLQAYTWSGHFDRVGGSSIINRDENPHHLLARSIRIEIVLVTTNKLMAYWIAEHAGEWRKQVYGWTPPAPPPLPPL